MSNSDAEKPSKSLANVVLFPCYCGNDNEFYIHIMSEARACFDFMGLESERGAPGYEPVEIDGTHGVLCIDHKCRKVYKLIEAEKACEVYREYLDCEDKAKKRAAWQRFLRARRKAVKAPDEVAKGIKLC